MYRIIWHIKTPRVYKTQVFKGKFECRGGVAFALKRCTLENVFLFLFAFLKFHLPNHYCFSFLHLVALSVAGMVGAENGWG